MKIALTAMLCLLLTSGALVLALWPLPQGEALVRLWGTGLLAALAIPVAWALVFAVGALVASDALVGPGLGAGLEMAVKRFVAVACLYLVYRAPGFLVTQARLLGMRVSPSAGRQASPGQGQLSRVARAHATTHADHFRGLGAAIGRPATAGAGAMATAVRSGARAAGHAARRAAAAGAVNVAAAGQGMLGEVSTRAAVGAASMARRAGRQGPAASDWLNELPQRGAATRESRANGGRRPRQSVRATRCAKAQPRSVLTWSGRRRVPSDQPGRRSAATVRRRSRTGGRDRSRPRLHACGVRCPPTRDSRFAQRKPVGAQRPRRPFAWCLTTRHSVPAPRGRLKRRRQADPTRESAEPLQAEHG
jgi:hypothetical protein